MISSINFLQEGVPEALENIFGVDLIHLNPLTEQRDSRNHIFVRLCVDKALLDGHLDEGGLDLFAATLVEIETQELLKFGGNQEEVFTVFLLGRRRLLRSMLGRGRLLGQLWE